MRHSLLDWLARFLPQPNTVDWFEQMRACTGALCGLAMAGFISYVLLGNGTGTPGAVLYLAAPMGASAVLLFCVPASPLAQPWSIIGGNLVSALVGVTCATCFGTTLPVAALAGCIAIFAMFRLRCLHPPGGAVALTAVLGGPVVHASGYWFVFLPIGLNSLLLLGIALVFNNLTGRRYPHLPHALPQQVHATADRPPTLRLGFTPDDLDTVLKHYNQVLDVSRDDLETIFLQTEMHAYQRRFGIICCGEIMSKDVVTLTFQSPLDVAWRLMRHHRVAALPVLDDARKVVGMLEQSDFFQYADENCNVADVLRRMPGMHRQESGLPQLAGHLMRRQTKTVTMDTPIVELVTLMADSGLHHIPVLDDAACFAGIVTQSDVLAALYASRLADIRENPVNQRRAAGA